MTDPSSNVCYTDKDESKRIIVHKTLSQNCSANEDKSKGIIANKTFSHKYSADVENICPTEEYKSEWIITKQQDAGNQVIYDVPYGFNVSNVFGCGRNNPDVSYEQAYMATERDEYST